MLKARQPAVVVREWIEEFRKTHALRYKVLRWIRRQGACSVDFVIRINDQNKNHEHFTDTTPCAFDAVLFYSVSGECGNRGS